MKVEEAVNIIKEWIDKPMTDQQYYKYHCAQNKVTRVIADGTYELVKKEEATE